MSKVWQKNEISRCLQRLTIDNAVEIAREIGSLICGTEEYELIEPTWTTFGARCSDVGIRLGDGDLRTAFLDGLGNPRTQRIAEQSVYILLPGEHIDDQQNRTEHPVNEVVRDILAAIPRGAIYRWAKVVGTIDGKPGERYFRIGTTEIIRSIVDEHVKLARWKAGKNGARMEYVSCPADLAKMVLSAAETFPTIPEIEMLVSYPVYGPKTGMSRPGYSAGIYYDQPESLRNLPTATENPRDVLYDLVVDFPFADDASRDNFIGLLLTPIVRPALKGNVPLTMVTASLERTGKSKLVESVFGGVILGKPTPALQMSGSEDEIDKRITASLIMGGTIMYVDNVNEFMDSASIASLITSAVYVGRLLGFSKLVPLPNQTTVVGTANNPKMTGEIAKRTVPIVLQPRTNSPETRTGFAHPDITAYVLSVRPKILATLIGMIESWRAAGAPKSSVAFGGFERWAQIVGGIMEFHGFSAWMKNYRAWSQRANPRGQDMSAFAAEWWRAHGPSLVAAKDLFALAESNEWFIDLPGRDEKAKLVSFSKRVLASHEDTPVETWIIRRTAIRAGKTLWKLEPQAEPATVTPTTTGNAEGPAVASPPSTGGTGQSQRILYPFVDSEQEF